MFIEDAEETRILVFERNYNLVTSYVNARLKINEFDVRLYTFKELSVHTYPTVLHNLPKAIILISHPPSI